MRLFFAILALTVYFQATVAGDLLHGLYHAYSANSVQEHEHAAGTFKASTDRVQLTDRHHDAENGCSFFGILHSAKSCHLPLQTLTEVFAQLGFESERGPAVDIEFGFDLNPQDSPRGPPQG
jgi:hypothetical protein